MRFLAFSCVLLLAVVSGCDCNPPPPTQCADNDGDGADGCADSGGDCNDNDAAVKPGAKEVCDGKDNNCDGKVDEGCSSAGCKLGDAPKACGAAGSACVQTCQADGTLGPCQPPSGPVDTQNDARNCGQCGSVCPTAPSSTARCNRGVCELISETGVTVQAFSSGGSFGSTKQTSSTHTNTGILGEAVSGAVIQTSSTHKNIGGFMAAEQ